MTFSSVYQILTPLKTVRKQKFWDWFDGNDARSWWTKRNIAGSGTFTMQDTVDGGFRITTGSVNVNRSAIDFNQINHYDETACVFIGVIRGIHTTNIKYGVGGKNVADITPNIAWGGSDTFDSANFLIKSIDSGASNSFTASSVALDTTFRVHKLEFGSANIKWTMNGILEATHTTNRPSSPLEPVFFSQTRFAGSRTSDIRYLEAYNT